jgi:hypothetical protein
MAGGARSFLGWVFGIALLATPVAAQAQSAELLPQGIFKADAIYVHANTGVRRVHSSLDAGSAGNAGSGADLVSGLAGLGPTASGDVFGNSYLEFSASANVIAPSLFYGLTDWLTLGFAVPIFLDAKVSLHHLEVGTGSLGYNTDFAADMARQSPVISVSDPRAAAGGEGIKRMLVDVFQYEELEDWESSGLGDIIVAGRVGLLNRSWIRAALQPSLVVPTGEPESPHNLVDFGLGGGQWDIGGLALVDFVLHDNFMLNVRGGHTVQLANQQEARIYELSDVPIAPRERLSGEYAQLGTSGQVLRDLGDVTQGGASLRYMRGIFAIGAGYDLHYKGKDRYQQNGVRFAAMEANTDFMIHTASAEIAFNWVNAFLAGNAPAPVEVSARLSQSISEKETEILTQAMFTTTLFFGSPPDTPAKSEEGEGEGE